MSFSSQDYAMQQAKQAAVYAGTAGGSMVGGAVPVAATAFEQIAAQYESHIRSVNQLRDRLCVLANRLSGPINQATDRGAGVSPPREVPSNTLRRHQMLSEEMAMALALLNSEVDRLETL